MAVIAKILVVIGGLNWGLIGLGMLLGKSWNVVYTLVGSVPTLEAIVYVLVGIAAIMSIFSCKCNKCGVTSVPPVSGMGGEGTM